MARKKRVARRSVQPTSAAPSDSDSDISPGEVIARSILSGSSSPTSPLAGWQWLLITVIAYTLCLPPMELWPLATIALTGLTGLAITDRRPPLRLVWIAGFVHWAITFQFLRLPHWTGFLGVILISAYTALYDVAYVWLVSRLSQRRWPVLVSAPLAWAGLETVRSTLFSGIPIGILGHALYRQPLLIQTADLAGEVTVSAILAMVGAAIAQSIIALLPTRRYASTPQPSRKLIPWFVSPGVAIVVVAAAIFYGQSQIPIYQLPGDSVAATIGIVQGSQDVQFGLSDEVAQQEMLQSFAEHQKLTIQARKTSEDLDAVVWPESMFPWIDILPLDDRVYQWTQEEQTNRGMSVSGLLQRQQLLPYKVMEATGAGGIPAEFPTCIPLIAGMRSLDVYPDVDYNAAIQFDKYGQITQRYSKVHLVPFGEFLPLGDWIPQLYALAPIPRGLTPGKGHQCFQVAEAKLIPTICYESVIGWHVRNYVLQQNQDRNQPGKSSFDALLNISNDGWFWGSEALDLHLASNVFRAVENRAQHLVACNTGISANILPDGTILEEAQRRTPTLILANVPPRPNWTPVWWKLGNSVWWLGLLLAIVGSALPEYRLPQRMPEADRRDD